MAIPQINNNQDLASYIGVKKGVVAYYAYYLDSAKAYTSFSIKKRSGGERTIDAPVRGLKELQRTILKKLTPEATFRHCVYGYIPGKGILQNSAVHVRQRWVLRVDIKDFFPSITTARVSGMFMHPPFCMAPKAARALALISTKDGFLPQGSPLSPWITNVICKGLDYNLKRLASKHKCYYSRYADDLFFSTSNSLFPASLARKSDTESNVIIGEELKSEIVRAGFLPNEEKTSLKPISQRQVVTGIVVNSRTNVPREYVKKIRAALYSWEKFGLEAAEEYWRNKVDSRDRAGEPPRFRWVVRGQINFVKHVKGEADPVYLSLAKKLKKLDDKFTFDAKVSALSVIEEVQVFVEGVTDKKHIEKAFRDAQQNGLYLDLNLTFPNQREYGSSNLKSLCETLSANAQRCLTICIFDRDEQAYVKSMGGSSGDYMDHNNNVFSLIIPRPSFRAETDICIEHLYKDSDLFKVDGAGRRLYKKSEFDKHSCHLEDPCIFIRTPPKSLICDSGVINISTKASVALSKVDFATNIHEGVTPFDDVSFEGFRPLFTKIQEIKNLFRK
ncbi:MULTISPECIES: reverse transcriptase domain-containing protein [Pseudomonas]|uniref:reverse transcriptase domain-containing protein n=1 Tax=Pseudomonas TaxID=286 RepID=UPI001022CD42|nr:MULTISPECIES: reverse transcriptase domain-containing protein [Pseudomonas]MDO4234309.1 reverse transcriptase domain-containing protein [Pseudomonas sp.]RZI25853.1 RNA-directed DNA polymerase [Pseudomonas orientalis]